MLYSCNFKSRLNFFVLSLLFSANVVFAADNSVVSQSVVVCSKAEKKIEILKKAEVQQKKQVQKQESKEKNKKIRKKKSAGRNNDCKLSDYAQRYIKEQSNISVNSFRNCSVENTEASQYEFDGFDKRLEHYMESRYCFNKAGVSVPHTADVQYYAGEKVSKESLSVGDLVFFRVIRAKYNM